MAMWLIIFDLLFDNTLQGKSPWKSNWLYLMIFCWGIYVIKYFLKYVILHLIEYLIIIYRGSHHGSQIGQSRNSVKFASPTHHRYSAASDNIGNPIVMMMIMMMNMMNMMMIMMNMMMIMMNMMMIMMIKFASPTHHRYSAASVMPIDVQKCP